MRSTRDVQQRLETLYWTEQAISNPIKWAILLTGGVLLYYWEWDGLRPGEVITLAAYALQNLAFTLLFSRGSFSPRVAKILALVSYAIDFLFVGYLIFGLGGTASEMAFLMFLALIFKAGLYYPIFKGILLVLPLAIVFYIVMLVTIHGASVLGMIILRPRLILLLGIPAITSYTAFLLDRRQQYLVALNNRLNEKTVELNRQAKELQTIVHRMHDGLLVIDPELNINTMNRVAAAVLRLETDSRTTIALDAGENGRAVREVVSDALSSPERTGRREIQMPLPNEGEDEAKCYQAVASFISENDGTNGQVVVILRDITEARRLENAKSNFLSIVSHELRTPLSSIKGFLNVILGGRAGALSETQTDLLQTALGQAEYLNSLINDLVELSRIQMQRADLDLASVSLAEITRSVTARLRPLAKDKGLELVNQVPPNLPAISGDELRLEQVVSNLVVNAIKFTPTGVITLSAREQGGEEIFSVSDTGVGIPMAQQDKIFEDFYQVSHGSARLYGGLGIGLTICRHIVERHGGRLYFESEEGKGTVFSFALPKRGVQEESVSVELARLS